MYIANVSLQLSDTMRVLTVFSVILMPLTLIVGIYGMNGLDLSHITSLPSGLLTVVLTMVVIILLLLVFFKRKQWIFIKEEEHDNSKNQNNR